MQREIKVGTISWINRDPNPTWTSAQAAFLSPDWVPKTYLGLAATCNSAPPMTVADFKLYQKSQDFRALTFCRFRLDIDDEDAGQINSLTVLDAVHDPGWTPAFKMRHWPGTAFAFDANIYSFRSWPGEASPLSLVNTQARHNNSSLAPAAATESVLVNALIKFRAGSHTDSVGVNEVKAPFHVPWVWCEMLLTYASGTLKVYARGSIFPSHSWFLNDKKMLSQGQVGDTAYPMRRVVIMRPGPANPFVPDISFDSPSQIYEYGMKIYPVLSKGAPASGPQTSLGAESSLSGSVETHPNTVAGGALLTASA
jgi:hypothetical protein